jgi:hypothetical protein
MGVRTRPAVTLVICRKAVSSIGIDAPAMVIHVPRLLLQDDVYVTIVEAEPA